MIKRFITLSTFFFLLLAGFFLSAPLQTTNAQAIDPATIDARCNVNKECTSFKDCGDPQICSSAGVTCVDVGMKKYCRRPGSPAGAAGTATTAKATQSANIKFTTKLGPAKIDPDPILSYQNAGLSYSKDATLTLPVRADDLGHGAKWAVRIRCGLTESNFQKFDTKNNGDETKPEWIKETAAGLQLKLHNDTGTLSVPGGDCQFQPAGIKLTRPIDIEIFKDDQIYGATFYTVDTSPGILLPDARTDPSPITEKTTSAYLIVPIPPNPYLKPIPNSRDPSNLLVWTLPSQWTMQVRCGFQLFGDATTASMPNPVSAEKFGVDKFRVPKVDPQSGIPEQDINNNQVFANVDYNTVYFILTNGSKGAMQACEFGIGDPIDVEIWRQGVLYGRTRYFVSPKNASTSLPPPCTKWVAKDRNDKEVPITTEMDIYGKERNGTQDLSEWLQEKGYTDYRCVEVKTAIGDIQTTPTGFVQNLYGILLSLAGGIALVLIMLSGYQIRTSQGDPEKMQGARETLTSAVIGLMFILLSLVILQIIGYDILRIPGLKPS